MGKWFIGFCALFLVGYIPFGWNGYTPLVGGIPLWYLFIAFMFIAFSVVSWLFVKYYWDPMEQSENEQTK